MIDLLGRKREGRSLLSWSAKKCISYLLIAAVIYAAFNTTNYLWTLDFEYRLPPVDAVRFLRHKSSIPSGSHSTIAQKNFTFSNNMLVDIIKDVYIRRESEYLQHRNESTIVVSPRVKWTGDYIKLNLDEGAYFFSNGSTSVPDLKVTNTIQQKLTKGDTRFDFSQVFESESELQAHQFIRRFIYTLFKPADLPVEMYSIDALSRIFHFMRIGCLGIMVASLLSFFVLAGNILFEPHSKVSLYLIYSSLVLLKVASGFFQIFNSTLAWLIMKSFPSTSQCFKGLFYLLELLIYISLLVYPTKKFLSHLEKFDEAASATKLQSVSSLDSAKKESQSSSIYSEYSEGHIKELDFIHKPGYKNDSTGKRINTVQSAMEGFSPKDKTLNLPLRNYTAPVFRTITESSSPLMEEEMNHNDIDTQENTEQPKTDLPEMPQQKDQLVNL
ncbi:Piso0_001116 [Millerozyma farinosa CBS 7064]|uniref:Piso0_001116 protein n=1 Tax=Pichia sorbitophila (strain ATCC MYA-4447 / BCRC 22081 / CBS 7064 / NBRC 10061 / NRRL Y-12695) TaxID=559304 RepID=G8YQZ4_PICSO|nr:Piso0_001116 [Millerozyma farinosa CBS 7064]CCE79079.1 Piso0_001116 [Millerozyma farinosa CBS 7064]